ncbi:MAG: metal ABC transporter substrate-binding protein [Chthoniobacter sp.]
MGDAQLILLSAKHMESYVGKLKEATGTKGDLVEVGDGFATLKMKSEKDPDKVIDDPHWWHSIANTEKAVKIVRDELIKVSPADKQVFTDNAAKYLAKLDELQKWVKNELAKLAPRQAQARDFARRFPVLRPGKRIHHLRHRRHLERRSALVEKSWRNRRGHQDSGV